MAVSIETHKELEAARARCSFCYLCGRGFRNFAGIQPIGTRVEHIIPKGVLGAGRDGFVPATLWVHDECDRLMKQRHDSVTSAYTKLSMSDPAVWKQRQLNQVKQLFADPVYAESGERVPSVSAAPMMMACLDWLRGLHAIMYAQFIPDRIDAFEIIPPFVSFYPKRGGKVASVTIPELREKSKSLDESWQMISSLLGQAEQAGRLDRLSCWGGQVQFKAVWMPVRKSEWKRTRFQAVGFWMLEYPRIRELAKYHSGGDMCWHGFYYSLAMPSDAARLCDFLPRR